jgi:hypothetical protein
MRAFSIIVAFFAIAGTSLLKGPPGGASAPASLTTLTVGSTGSGAALSVSSGGVDLSGASAQGGAPPLKLANGDIVYATNTQPLTVEVTGPVFAACPAGYGVMSGSCAGVNADSAPTQDVLVKASCPGVCTDATNCTPPGSAGACMVSGSEQVGDHFTAGALQGTVQAVGWRCIGVSAVPATLFASVHCFRY